jgi:hypothetical protein
MQPYCGIQLKHQISQVNMEYFNPVISMQPYCGIQLKHQISQVRIEIKDYQIRVESRYNYKRSKL